jgi:hypothetical protein
VAGVTDDLVAWLRYQIQTDISLAQQACGDHNDVEPDTWHELWSGSLFLNAADTEELQIGDAPLARHIINWQPKRALDEAEAKRRIVDICAEPDDHPNALLVRGRILALLARPYADRPGFRDAGFKEQWRA